MASSNPHPLRGRPSGAPASPVTGSTPNPKSTRSRSKYASRACEECRRRRAKCDGNKPCGRCAARKLVCKTAGDEDARGTAPKSYVRMLQARIDILERILQLYSIDIDAAAAQLEKERPVSTTTTSIAAGSSTAFDQLCGCFEGSLILDESLNFDHDGEARYFGPSSGRLDFLGDSNQEEPSNDVAGNAPFEQEPTVYTDTMGDRLRVSEELESHLLDLYFTWEQPWFPVVEERLFRESKTTKGRYYSPLLLNSILAVASRHSDRLEVRTDLDDANTAGRMFLEEAEILLRFDIRKPSITTLQSVAILGTVYVAFGYDAAGWLHQGMAVRMVLDMGMHLDSSALANSKRISLDEAELRRQIYWALYCVDKLCASYTGRLCTMLDFQGVVGLPSTQHQDEHTDNRNDQTTINRTLLITLQNALSTICQILESILLTLYAPRKLPSRAQKESFFASTLLALKSWFYTLSPEMKPIRAGKVNGFPQAITLCMVYHTTIILLAKPFLNTEYDGQAGTVQTQGDPFRSSLSQQAVAVTLEAAKNISILGDHYREGFGSFRKSPLTATHCTLSAVLAMLQLSTRSENTLGSNNSDKIGPCLTTLYELSTSWTPPRRYHHNLLKLMHRATIPKCQKDNSILTATGGGGDATADGQHLQQQALHSTPSLSRRQNNEAIDPLDWTDQLFTVEPFPNDPATFIFDTPFWPGVEADENLAWEQVPLKSAQFDTPR